MIRVRCADCDGSAMIGDTYACVRCTAGMVAADDFGTEGPDEAPTAVPVSFVDALMTAASTGAITRSSLLFAVSALRSVS